MKTKIIWLQYVLAFLVLCPLLAFAAPAPELSVLITPSTYFPIVGQEVTLQWVLTNAGPVTATGISVTNFLSPGLQYVSSAGNGSYNSSAGIWAVSSLQGSSSVSLSVTVTAVTAGLQTNEISTGNSSGNASDTAVLSVTLPEANLSVTTAPTPEFPVFGDQVVFQLVLTNAGPDTVTTNITVTNFLSAGLQYVCDTGGTANGIYNPAAGIWTVPGLAASNSVTLSVTTTAIAAGEQTNIVSVGDFGGYSSDTAIVDVVEPEADLGITTTPNTSNPVQGQNVTFQFVLTNNGPDNVTTAISVTNFLSSGLQYLSDTSGGAYNPGTGIWTVSGLPAYSGATMSLTVTAAGFGQQTNILTVGVPSGYLDPNTGNNTAYAFPFVSAPQANLGVTTTANANSLAVGQQVVFTLALQNLGPNNVPTNIVVMDCLPAGFTYVTDSTIGGGTPGAYSPSSCLWTLPGGLAANATINLNITAQAASTGTFTNTATVAVPPGVTDPNLNNNTSSAVVTVNTASSPINLVCSSNIIVGADGPNGATAVFYNVTATGGCSTPTINSVPASGSIFPIGTNVVNCTASDSCADQTGCSFTVTVTPPPLELVCSPDLTIAATDSNGAVVVYYTTVNNSCTLPNVISSPPSGSTFPVGPTLVTVIATDSYGQQAQCSFKVTVTPSSPPVPTTITTFNYDTNAGLLHLEWTSAAGKVYTVQESLDLNSWQNFLQGVPSGGNLTTNQVPVSNGVSANFFRIREDVPPEPFAGDPIVSVGEGAILGADGEQIQPTLPFILSAQQYYISQLMTSTPAQLAAQSIISNDVSDQVLANALFIDWLTASNATITTTTPQNINAKNDALRFYYLFNMAQSPILPGTNGTWARGIVPSVATNLENSGIPVFIALETPTQQQAYTNSCAAKGVPIPPSMYTGAWMNLGQIQDPFISTDFYAELWIYVSKDPPGVCLALPRYELSAPGAAPAANAPIKLLGLICLGFKAQADGNCYACFWDNPAGSAWKRGDARPITDFVSGANLRDNGGGSCTDCHAGEDSFVVHPNKAPFKMAYMKVAMGIAGRSASLNADKWYTPFGVPSVWPQNPNPGIDWGGDNCTKCHTLGDQAGRFPLLFKGTPEAEGTPDYCGTILQIATQTMFDAPSDTVSAGVKPPNPTMPPGSKAGNSKFWGDVEQLYLLCGQPPPEKAAMVPNPFPPAKASVSAPSVVGPLYASATMVAVQGAILGATVTLYTNGVAASSVANARSPSQIVFNIPALIPGVQVTASQIAGGATNVSAPVVVDDYFTDFPGPLSPPYLDEVPIYQGANVIQAISDPGVTLTILRNGVQVAQVPTASGVTIIPLTNGSPFQVGDMFQAFETIEGISSTNSDPVYAISDPTSLPAPTLDTLQTYQGQQLITIDGLVGAETSVIVNGVVVGQFSYPGYSTQFDLTTSGLGRALQAGDQLTLSQSFGTTNMSGPSTNLPPTASSCDNLPAPSILTPVAGVNYVKITQSIPDAQVYVFDATGAQLGNGSGSTINLNRAIVCGDILTVVQQVGDCTSATGYRITVGPCACQ